MFKTILLLAFMLMIVGNASSTSNKWELDLDGLHFDTSTKSNFLNTTHIVIASQLRTLDQHYQISLKLINIHENSIVKETLIGDQNSDYYSPQILTVEKYIYLAYVNQALSLINAKIKKFDQDLVEQQGEQILGESLESAKFDNQFGYLKLSLLSKNSLAILWYSRARDAMQRQWNFRQLDLNQDLLSETIFLPSSKLISVAQNQYGITAFAQYDAKNYPNQVFLSRFSKTLTTRIITTQELFDISVFNLPNNNFLVVQTTNNPILRYFNHLFDPIRHPIHYDWITGMAVPGRLLDYNLYFISEQSSTLKVIQLDVQNPFQEIPWRQQERILYQWKNFESQSIQGDIINHNFYIRWLQKKNYYDQYSQLQIFFFDMSTFVEECISNCITCNPRLICKECQVGYTLIENTCQAKCPDNCHFCSNPQFCDQCQEGYQYTLDNLCITPTSNYIDLKISDEETIKGKPIILTIDNEVILIYGVYWPNSSYLKIKKLNSQGQELIQTDLIDEQLRDYDLTYGNDHKTFTLLVKWSKNEVSSIINYVIKVEDLQIVTYDIFLSNITPEMSGDQLKIINFQNNQMFYFYITYENNNYKLNYLIRSIDGQQQASYITYSIFDNFLLQTFYNDNLFLNVINNDGQALYYLYSSSFYISESKNSEQFDRLYQNLYYFDQSTFSYTDYENSTQRLYLNVTKQRIQISYTSKKPRKHSIRKIGDNDLFVVWLGESNIEKPQYEQVYLQRISLETLSISDLNQLICTKDCGQCDEFGVCKQCRSENFNLLNGKCQLICPQNCNKCQKEFECQSCEQFYYLNSKLNCVLSEQQYLYKIDDAKQMYISGSSDSNFHSVYFLFNNTKFEVIYEELDRKGDTLSGQIRISIEEDKVLRKQLKVIQKNQYVYIGYVRQTIGSMQQVFVILDKFYQVYSRSYMDITKESDFTVKQDLEIYWIYTVQYGENKFIQIRDYLISGNVLIWQWDIISEEGINEKNEYLNIRFANNNKSSSKFLIQFTTIVNLVATDQFIVLDSKLQRTTKFNKHSNGIYYKNQLETWFVVYDVITDIINISFYNNDDELQKEHSIQSLNQIITNQIYKNDFNVYLIYIEKSSIMQIKITQFNINGEFIKDILIQTNEVGINGLNAAVNNEFILLAWSSILNEQVYQVLLTKDLAIVPIDQEVCIQNCDICETNDQCSECSLGYSNDNSSCKPICPENCLQCSKPFTCDVCKEGFIYFNLKCKDAAQLQIEQSICSETCYGVASMTSFNDYSLLLTYANYDSQEFSILAQLYPYSSSNSLSIKQTLIIQSTKIEYHETYAFGMEFLLIWLSGNCQVQCRLMLQTFNKDFSSSTNSIELRIMTVDFSQFNLQINNLNNDFVFVWTELDINQIPQSYFCQYNLQTGASLIQNINQNSADISIQPNLVLQERFKVIYIKNYKTINILTLDESNTYQEIYKTENPIQSLSVLNALYSQGYYYKRILVGWIEISIDNHKLNLQSYDWNFNTLLSCITFPTQNRIINNLQLKSFNQGDTFIIVYIEQESETTFKIKSYLTDFNQIRDSLYSLDSLQTLNVYANLLMGYPYKTFVFPSYVSYTTFRGISDNKQQIFVQKGLYGQSNLPQCDQSCFYCDQDMYCQICKEGYELKDKFCQKKLPNYCDVGQNGICYQCSDGYNLDSNVCILYDPQYKEIKMNTYTLQSKQRTSTFSNGDYIVVWFRKYYENQGTGIFMSLYNSHGETLQDETCINLSSVGIQAFPDVQVLQNDEFILVWIEGDLETNANIKKQRFTRQFIRIGDEQIIKQNIQLNNAKQYDTPVMIQKIINGYAIVWTQNIEQKDQLQVIFYDQQSNYQSEYVLSQDYHIKKQEVVVASNQQVIVILWGAQLLDNNQGIIASVFSLNNILINTQILSKNGQAPSITVLNNGNFITAWRQQVYLKNLFQSYKIIHRQYINDMSSYLYSFTLGENEYNLNNPDVINTNEGYSIIFENIYYSNTDIRNLKLQLFNLEGQSKTNIITVTNQKDIYPHHPKLNALPQGEFIAFWSSSPITQNSLTNDIYMKRYNSDGEQLLLSTIVCINNCQTCVVNDICSICMDGYILVQQRCFKAIQNCNNYQQDSSELVCTQCNSEYQLTNNRCLNRINNVLTVEFVNEISLSFRQIILSNDDILYLWADGNYIMIQRFDKFGNPLNRPKSQLFSDNIYFFNAAAIQNQQYMIAVEQRNMIIISIFDQNENKITQTAIQLLYSQPLTPAQSKFAIQIKEIGQFRYQILYLIVTIQNQIELHIAQIQLTYRYYPSINFENERIINIGKQIQDMQLYEELKILMVADNKSRYGYFYLSYDSQGNIQSNYKILLNNRRIEYKIAQLSNSTFIELWTEVELSAYEIYYQVKRFDNTNVTDQIQILSTQIYKMDIEILLKVNAILLIWREGSDEVDMNANTFYQVLVISPETFIASKISLNQIVNPMAEKLKISQLSNNDLIFSLITSVENTNVLTAIKVSPQGQPLKFSGLRCESGCQECTNQGCIKCIDSYRLSAGKCFVNQTSCLNFQPDCLTCQEGFYKTKYMTCELLQQFLETKIKEVPTPFYRQGFYQDGRSVIIENKQSSYLEMTFYGADSLVQKEAIIILQVSSDVGYIKDFDLLITKNNILTVIVQINRYCWNCKSEFNILQFDEQFTQIADQITIYSVQLDSYNFKLKELQNNQIGIVIQRFDQIYLAVYNNDFISFIGNNIIKASTIVQDFDLTSNVQNIILTYSFTEERAVTIVRFYDNRINFIKDVSIMDSQPIKITVNSIDQVIVASKNQLNIIEKLKILFSVEHTDLNPQQISTNSLNQIIVLYQQNQLILAFYDKQGKYLFEQQANMLLLPVSPFDLYTLSNNDLIIRFQEYIQIGYYYSQQFIFISKFDQYGKTKAIGDIVCPKNCEICINSKSCQICSNAYERNEETLLCKKICTIQNCQSCENSDCDVCLEGFSLDLSGQCVLIVYDPIPDSLQSIDQCSIPIEIRTIKFINNDYALVYFCLSTIQIKKFNTLNEQLLEYSTTFYSSYVKFDAQLVNDLIYILLVPTDSNNQVTIYKLDNDFTQLNVAAKITSENQITKLFFASVGSQYMIILSDNKFFNIDNSEQLCEESSYYIFDQKYGDKKINEKKAFQTPMTVNDCNRNTVKSIKGIKVFYVIISQQYGVQVAKFDSTGLLGYQFLQIQSVTDVYFDVTSSRMVFLTKSIGNDFWSLSFWDTTLTSWYLSDQYFLYGNYEVSIVSTELNILIAWSSQGSIEYKLFDLNGNLINYKILQNSGTNIKPQLIKLQSSAIGICWTGLNNQQQYGLSFAVIDQQGEFIKLAILCSNNCNTCSSPTTCTICNEGFILIKDACLQQCSSICQSCDYNTGTCLRCGKNYIPSAETCIIDEFQQSAIEINEYTSLSQTQADAVTFQDGSLITVWSSMGEDGDSWGVYVQLQDSQGNKVGDNIRVSESTQGSQHSPQIVRLTDDTALIIFIDGNPSIQASIKGVRFSNQMKKLGNEQLFATFSYKEFQILWSDIVQVESLRNGGFVIVLVTDQQDDYQKIISLTFYDGSYNIVNQNSFIANQGDQFKIASTNYNFAFIQFQYDQSVGYYMNAKIYTLDGQFIQNKPIEDYETMYFYYSRIVGNNQYYAIVTSKQEGKKIQFQLFDSQFSKYGNSVIIEEDNQNQYQKNQISIASFTSGFQIIVSHRYYSGLPFYNQYSIDFNWEVKFIKKFHLISEANVICVESVNNQYFLIWVSDVESIQDISNIYVQRCSKQGELMKIDEIACSPNCEKCEISQTCTICVDNYQLVDQKCNPICDLHCSFCTIPNQCDICENGYYLPMAGKCSPLPITYYEPEIVFAYSDSAYVFDISSISSDTFAIYSSEYSWVDQKQLFQMNVIQNKQVIKTISPLVYTLPTNYQQVYPYYLDDNMILVFYFFDRIVVKRFDYQSTLIFDQQVPWPAQIGSYTSSNTLLEPIQNNQYSLIYYYVNQAVGYEANDRNSVYKAVLGQQLNLISGPDLIYQSGLAYFFEKNKYSIQFFSFDGYQIQQIVTKDEIQKINCYWSTSTDSGSQSCLIYKIGNGNYVQILRPYQDINNYNYRYYTGSLIINYRILDSNYQVLTSEEKVIENNYVRQNFMKIQRFDDSFTIIIQQFNYLHQEYSQIVAQKFDNSGQKIGGYYLINTLKSSSFVQTLPYENGFIVFWQEVDNFKRQNIMYAKQYDQNGVESPWSNNAKCIPYCDRCINSYYCQTCSVNYNLDANYQCQVMCPINCDVCNTPTQCQQCQTGYQVIDGFCTRIQCINNCAQCTLDGICNSCETNYQFNTDKSQCQPICASNCSACTSPLLCDTCSSGFTITTDNKCQADYVAVVTQVQTVVSTPIIAQFPNGDYVELFYQSGDNAGVYFQLYTKDGVKVGLPTKVSGISRRRLLTSTIQQFAADLAVNENSFAVLWLDASSESTMAKLQKFDSQGVATSDIVQLGAYPQTDLTNIKLPCQIQTTSNNNFLISYFAQSDDSYSLFVETFDSQLAKKGTIKEIKKVNALSAPSITADENGVIALTYQSEGYLFVQQLTEDGETIDSPKAISDTNSLIVRTTNLENGFIVFLWENRSTQVSIQQFQLNFQLISKDLKTKSSVSTVGTIQKAQLDPDIQSFNSGFIIVWKLTDTSYKTSGLQFQMFDSLGAPTTNAIDVQIDGLYPDNPRIQIMNDVSFIITCTAKNIDTDGTILGDGIFMQQYNEQGIIIQDQKSLDLCSYQCQSCQSPLICLKCQTGYYLNSNNQCIMDCGSFCETCETPLTCKTCKNGYKLKDNSLCEETECSQGYVRNPTTKLCESQACPDNCDYCLESNNCSACKESYTLSTDNSCIQLQKNNSTDSEQVMYTIIIIILSAALVGTAICSITQYSQKKKLLNTRYNQVHPNLVVQESCNQTQIAMRE